MEQARADAVGAALAVPGFETSRSPRRVLLTSVDEPRRVVVWRVTDDQLVRHAEALQPAAREAWGSDEARGEWLLGVHLQEALGTFEGEYGEVVVEPGGLRVRSTGEVR